MMTGGEKYICIKSKMQGHASTLIIENSYNGIVKKKNNVILSSKRIDKEGIGFSSINAVCEKYGGSVFINYDTKEFSTSMVLYSL
jgi:sensor histidine kinase regulating citrate/malate metabolism